MLSQPEIMERLRPHQPGPFRHLLGVLQEYTTGLDMSDTGTGKTYVSAAVASALREPTLVVGPKIARSAWERAAKHFDDSFSYCNYELLRTGNTPFGKWLGYKPAKEFFKCQCCQCVVDLNKFTPCYAHPRGIHCLETKKRHATYGRFEFSPRVRNVIFDEVHRCGGLNSLNADMLIAAKRQGLRITGLSATPACSPLGMRAIGYALDLHNLDSDLLAPARIGQGVRLPSFYRWAHRFGCRRDPAFHGFKWFAGVDTQQGIMLDIRNSIIPHRGIRVTTDDIPHFPKRDIQAELYDLDDPEAVDSCYQEMAAALEQLKVTTANDKAPDHPLTKILRARQQVELLKVPVFSELGQDYLDKGLSVVFFVNFRQTIEELAKRFPDARIVDGQTPGRDASIEKFQTNVIRALIVNSDAGKESMSLQDLTGQFPRIGLVSPGLSAVTLCQIFGRLHRDGGKTQCYYRVIFANKTVEVKLHKIVQPKLNNLDALTDADLSPANLVF